MTITKWYLWIIEEIIVVIKNIKKNAVHVKTIIFFLLHSESKTRVYVNNYKQSFSLKGLEHLTTFFCSSHSNHRNLYVSHARIVPIDPMTEWHHKNSGNWFEFVMKWTLKRYSFILYYPFNLKY